MKKWFIYNKKADFKAVAAAHHIDQVTARILRNRDCCLLYTSPSPRD